MENPVYHVLLDGRTVGPYDRRTIVGMRVKKTLGSDHVLVGADGARTTVGALVRQDAPVPAFQASNNGGLEPPRPSSYSVIQAMHPATLLEVEGAGYAVPSFQGEIEVRVQTKVLRVAGRFREGRNWKEDRVKFPLQDIAHARLRGSVVDLWVRPPGGAALQRVSLDLGTPEAAGELAESLPHASPWPGSEPLAAGLNKASGVHPLLWTVVAGTVVAVGAVLVWVLTRP